MAPAPAASSPATRPSTRLLSTPPMPVHSPAANTSGRVVRYANSGCGVLPGAFTALEWDGGLDEPLRLVVHHLVDGRPTRTELHPEGEVLAAGRP